LSFEQRARRDERLARMQAYHDENIARFLEDMRRAQKALEKAAGRRRKKGS